MSSPWRDLLPTSVEVDGTEYEIRSDYRAVLDVCIALNDIELEEQERVFVLLDIFYPGFSEMPHEHYEGALKKCFWFINCGEEQTAQKTLKLMDWKQDFQYITAPINRVTGKEIRSVEYMHWWTFISAYREIGDCMFAQIVRIRDKLARGKALDKSDKEFYRQNRTIVDLKNQYSAEDEAVLDKWLGK